MAVKKKVVKKIAKVTSWMDLANKARAIDPAVSGPYSKLAKDAARNLGWFGSDKLDDALEHLKNEIMESGSEAGVVGEINFVR